MDKNKIKGIEVGSRLHDDWRSNRKLEDGTYNPRWKVTKDEGYEPIEGKSKVNEQGELEVDIANLSFNELPKDWQKENLEAGLAVTPIVGDRTELSNEEMEEASKKVHEEWSNRRMRVITDYMNELAEKGMSEEEIKTQTNEKFSWDLNLMVDYEELSEEEKQKDRDQVVQALKLNKEIDKGEIKLEDLAKKYDKEAKSI